MLRNVVTLGMALLLVGGLCAPVAVADRPHSREARRSQFNPFSVRPSVRPTVRFSPWAWFGGWPAGNSPTAQPAPARPPRREQLPVPQPQPGAALQDAQEEGEEDNDQPTPTSSMGEYEPPVRSPFRPPLRGPF